MARKDKVQVAIGTLRNPTLGKNYTNLQDALNDQAKCCGVDCCDNVIRLVDQVTGVLKKISIQNGALVVEDDA